MEPSDTLVQTEVIDPSINTEAALAEEFPTVVGSEEIASKPPVQPIGEGAFSVTLIAIEGSAHNANSPVIPQTSDNASFELAPSLALLKE
ncbi:hypothetical protein MRB53_002471 [Persea americana]|uniref:Uncharacterized protein n=1 Tax=Persea americana TaxID=3435 RepID=A0ACC2MUZ2_PERAE|nr:hypothetical protein MRB53_002471 [Persea americana]